ncbi:hypothetical protein GCM10011506_40850 [Marivirga lumbricoides]|uniref:Outer membrane protein beta-barrel domain-containing protein n=1 Tax=Marivirga lumbricoides TaxID=1046115 RepID=A0ABQ1N270_9BACT|nr:hypothetical protein GCM10011506_40850 [Marivirga lumbricoides]
MKKKRIIFILFLFILCIPDLRAQSYIGVKGGVNIPFVNFTDFVTDYRFSTGINTTPYFSLTYRYMHHPVVGVQAEIAYSAKGWQQNTFDQTGTIQTNAVRTDINYLEVPIYMHIALGKSNLKFNIDAGLYVAYAISTERTIQTDQDLDRVVLQYNIDTDNRGDFGLTMGGGVSYEFPFGIIQLEGSFKTGFANILPRNPITAENPAVSTNQVPSVNISYYLPLSKKKSSEK